jgi:hypothetical protein
MVAHRWPHALMPDPAPTEPAADWGASAVAAAAEIADNGLWRVRE